MSLEEIDQASTNSYPRDLTCNSETDPLEVRKLGAGRRSRFPNAINPLQTTANTMTFSSESKFVRVLLLWRTRESLMAANKSINKSWLNSFTMTSGLRSVRDKTLKYLHETLRGGTHSIGRLYQLVNLFGEELRRLKVEDGPSLAAANHAFNLNSVIGGQLSAEVEPQLSYVYPEGNWVECNIDSPYFMIGRTYYGKPILDRLLRYDTPFLLRLP